MPVIPELFGGQAVENRTRQDSPCLVLGAANSREICANVDNLKKAGKLPLQV